MLFTFCQYFVNSLFIFEPVSLAVTLSPSLYCSSLSYVCICYTSLCCSSLFFYMFIPVSLFMYMSLCLCTSLFLCVSLSLCLCVSLSLCMYYSPSIPLVFARCPFHASVFRQIERPSLSARTPHLFYFFTYGL